MSTLAPLFSKSKHTRTKQASTDYTHVVLSCDLSLKFTLPHSHMCRLGTILKCSAAAPATISTYLIGWSWGPATACAMTLFLFVFMCNHKDLLVCIMHDVCVTFLTWPFYFILLYFFATCKHCSCLCLEFFFKLFLSTVCLKVDVWLLEIHL